MHKPECGSSSKSFAMRPIGLVQTPYVRSQGTPIQGASSGSGEGVVEIFPEFAPGLLDLQGFERLWLICLLDRAAAPRMVVRPYLEDKEHGVFATRAPSRPNPIGLTSVRLLGIDGNRLRIADVDMLDGTPLLDIKPYLPAFDCFPVVRTGWYRSLSAAGAVADDRFEARNPDSHES